MKSPFSKCFCIIFLYFSCSVALAGSTTVWRTLLPGLEYTQLGNFANFPAGYVHAFRIDLQHYRLQLAKLPYDTHTSAQSFKQVMDAQQAVLASNAGFFTPELKPLGLRVSDSQLLNPMRVVNWWRVFFIQNNKAYLVKPQDYATNETVQFAIQAGPQLLQKNQVLPEANAKIAARTALGITAKNQVILLATENVLLSAADLAELMRRNLGCVEAMNLDGGSSTQLYTRIADFTLQIPSGVRVADALLVVAQ